MEVNGFEGNVAGKHSCLIIIHSLLSLDAPEKQHMRKAGDDEFTDVWICEISPIKLLSGKHTKSY